MEIILTKDVDRLGKTGDTVTVKDGFARNFLIPKGLGVSAASGNKEAILALMASRAKKAQLLKGKAEQMAGRLNGLVCTLSVAVGDQGKLHGAVTSGDIEVWLKAQGISLEKHQLTLPLPLSKLGEYDLPVKLHPEVTATLKVQVVQK